MINFKGFVITILFYIFRIFPINNKKIVISSYLGKGYGGEGKIIAEQLLKEKKQYDVVWLAKNMKDSVPDRIRLVKYDSLKSIFEQVTAKVWIDNRRKPGYVRKRKKQYYIQTWHGDVCIKYVEKDAQDTLPRNYICSAKKDSKMADVLVSGSEWRTQNYLNAFWFNGEILKGNLYKNYYLASNREMFSKSVREQLNIKKDCNILLYAPTFRMSHELNCYNIDYDALLKCLHDKFGGDWVIVLRLHPNIAELNSKISYSENVINGSLYPQINDLLVASSILITDYSGTMFEGFRAGKIVILYASDLKQYLNEDRGMYFRINKLPSPLAQNNRELINIVEAFNFEEYERERKRFIDNIEYYDVDGAKVISERINQIISL